MALLVQDLAHLREVQTFARTIGMQHQLAGQLRILGRLCDFDRTRKTRTVLRSDGAPMSFGFVVVRHHESGMVLTLLNGALVYHGRHDGFGSGAYPTLSVTLEPTEGWSIHS